MLEARLAHRAGESAPGVNRIAATVHGLHHGITEVRDVPRVTVRVSDAMMDLDQPLRIARARKELFSGMVPRTIEVLARTLRERGDPAMMFDGETSVDLAP